MQLEMVFFFSWKKMRRETKSKFGRRGDVELTNELRAFHLVDMVKHVYRGAIIIYWDPLYHTRLDTSGV